MTPEQIKAQEIVDRHRKEGLLELHCVSFSDAHDEYVSPPYWGYMITEKAKRTEQYERRAREYRCSLDALLGGNSCG